VIHPTAEVSPEARVGEGTQVWHHAQIRPRASIGANCILGKGVYIDADVVVGDNCKLQNGVFVYRPAVLEDGVFLGPGVIVTNDRVPRAVNPDGTLKLVADWEATGVTVRAGAAVGAGSVLLAGVTVGRWALVGLGSVVIRDVPDHGLVVGNPARLIGHVCACGARLPDRGSGPLLCTRCAAGTAASPAGSPRPRA
jgi:acetyltransferase-like isoleucine patch superfamily enzyme